LPPVAVHLDTPSVARVHDYYLGGTTNWAVDRDFGDQVLDRFPLMRRIAIVNRLFLNRVVRHLMGRGVRQFLDVGSGVLTAGATHHVADELALQQGRRPDARVVYVDNDPVAVAHAELALDSEGDPRRQTVVEADLRDPYDLWQRALDTEVLDPDQPVALLLVAVLHLQQLDFHGAEIGTESVERLRDLLPAGSYVAVSHTTDDGVSAEVATTLAGLKRLYDTSGAAAVRWRSRAEIAALVGDFRMLDPGWAWGAAWHPEDTGPTAPSSAFLPGEPVVWSGVAEKW
jgi:hypothetical protein